MKTRKTVRTKAPSAEDPGLARPSHAASPAHAKKGSSLRFRLRITHDDVIAVGPGKVALLEAIEQNGSITGAAKSLAMSYRRAWILLDELNRSLREPAVDSMKGGSHGGGSAVTDAGRELITLYRRIERTAEVAARADIRRLLGMLAR